MKEPLYNQETFKNERLMYWKIEIDSNGWHCTMYLLLNICPVKIDDWRNISNPKQVAKLLKSQLFGTDYVFSGFGSEYETTSPNDVLVRLRYYYLFSCIYGMTVYFLSIGFFFF